MKRILLGLAAWFCASVVLSEFGLLKVAPFPFPQILLLSLTCCLIGIFLLNRSLRNWLYSIEPEVLVFPHLVRFVGIYFLILYSEQKLPYEFAVVGGWGDIVVAVLALVILISRFISNGVGKRFILIWNIIGLLDILYVVSTAARLGMKDASSMAELTQLPLSLLPLFIVPIIIATHIGLFFRLRYEGSADLKRKTLARGVF